MENLGCSRSHRNAIATCLAVGLHAALCLNCTAHSQPARETDQDNLRLTWKDNILTVSSERIPGGPVQIWYLEAFCRSGSTHRKWEESVIPHKTKLVSLQEDRRTLVLHTDIDGGVTVEHEIRAERDAVDFRMTIENHRDTAVDVQWGQPCIRVGGFTGRSQEDYAARCFIVTATGQQSLDRLRRSDDALYKGGQIYVPIGIDLNDVNPRPLSPVRPAESIIGCYSADNRTVLAMAWDTTQELFQGVITCIHSDFCVGGLEAHEVKKLHGRLYILPNDPQALLARYRADFPASKQ